VKFIVTLDDGEDGYIVASCPALPGCHSQGETREETLANIKEAIEGFTESMREQGEAIPAQVVEEVEASV
jgi:predicted RNase H-like HicB family nuclease